MEKKITARRGNCICIRAYVAWWVKELSSSCDHEAFFSGLKKREGFESIVILLILYYVVSGNYSIGLCFEVLENAITKMNELAFCFHLINQYNSPLFISYTLSCCITFRQIPLQDVSTFPYGASLQDPYLEDDLVCVKKFK